MVVAVIERARQQIAIIRNEAGLELITGILATVIYWRSGWYDNYYGTALLNFSFS
jgi:hypothetical protein